MRPLRSDTVVVTGGDAAYFPLLDELRQSIAAVAPTGMPAFAVIDGGLTEAQKTVFAGQGVRVVTPCSEPAFPTDVLRREPRVAVNLSKLWLDRLFPEAGTVIFLDGDTWVQDWNALLLLEGAAQRGLAIVADNGRYWDEQLQVRWLLGGIGGLCQVRSFQFKNGRHGGLPQSLLRRMGNRAQLNAGVFALRTDAPHWRAMRAWQVRILRAGGKRFTCDQLSMAATIYGDGLPIELLPSGCNYIRPYRVDLTQPAMVEYFYPFAKVGIIHLAGQKRVRFDPNATEPVPDTEDRIHQMSFRFGHFHRMVAALIPAAARP